MTLAYVTRKKKSRDTMDWHDLEGIRVWPVGPEPKVRGEGSITPRQISPVPDMIAYL